MRKELVGTLLLLSSLPAFAATTLNLNYRSVANILPMMNAGPVKLEEVSRATDFNHTLHVRMHQTYQGYTVWASDVIVHIPQGGNFNTPAATINGKLYQNITADLQNTPAYVFSQAQADKASQQAVAAYQQKIAAKPALQNITSKLIIFIAPDNKAHWAYKITFDAPPVKANEAPERPVYIIDALTLQIYKQWNDIKTMDNVNGGGNGGNKKVGKLVYDGIQNNLPVLKIHRNPGSNLCFLENDDVVVKDSQRNNAIEFFTCETKNSDHNGIYWDGAADAVKGGYSPANDALYEGSVVKGLYQDWYQVPVLVEDGKPMKLTMVMHANMDNAYWDGKQMTFGDGVILFYPLTSLTVAAHEISHGFTEQHSNLTYAQQSGAMNEAFSDMAAQASEFYLYGKNSWKIGHEVTWLFDALRYMDKPSKDCTLRPAGWMCSIDDASQYTPDLDVHFASGVYNRFFYLLSTAPDWSIQKAFNVMVQANMHYWTADSSFTEGACGVVKAATDYGYDTATVISAAKAVKIDIPECTIGNIKR